MILVHVQGKFRIKHLAIQPLMPPPASGLLRSARNDGSVLAMKKSQHPTNSSLRGGQRPTGPNKNSSRRPRINWNPGPLVRLMPRAWNPYCAAETVNEKAMRTLFRHCDAGNARRGNQNRPLRPISRDAPRPLDCFAMLAMTEG